MKTKFLCLSVLFSSILCGQVRNYKFDFGSGKNRPGYISITPQTKYNDETGYGFNANSNPEAIDRGGTKPENDFILSGKPFSFSVRLSEGNYDIRIVMGDKEGTSATTVRAECRRLMLENIRTSKGKIVTKTITVHIRDSLIRDKQGNPVSKVRLKPREYAYAHWDNLLTLEFNDSLSKIAVLEITPNNDAVTIFLAGNSTVVDQDREPWAAWGQIFPVFLIPSKIVVANYAESGETLKAFRNERRLDKIWAMAKAGDYLFIEFTHNDQKPGGNHLDPFTTYKETLKAWIREAREHKMHAVLVTSMHRRSFDSTGHITNTLLDYPEAMRQTAKEEGVPLIDLNAMSKTLYESMGEQGSLKAFVHYPANSYPNQPEALKDNTHFSPYGAYQLAACVVTSILKQKLPLAKYIQKDFKEFDPSKPMSFAKFYWPPSVLNPAVKPDGQ